MSTEFFNDQWRIPSNENQNKVSNYSMDFDGSSDAINVNSLASTLGSKGSFSAWVNVADWSSRAAILGFAYDQDNFMRLGVRPNNNNCFTIGGQFNNVSNEMLSDTTSLSENVWYHVVATSDGSVYKLYINGQLQTLTILAGSNNGNWVSDFSSTANKGTIGYLNRSGPSEDLFNGKIDQVTVFDYALSQDQVTQLGAEGYAFKFDGNNDYINFGDSDDFSFSTNTTNDSPFSISGWVKPDNTSTFRFIRKAPFNTGVGWEYIITTNSSSLLTFLIYSDASNRIGRRGSTAITSTDWQHWTFTYDGTGKSTSSNSGIKIYVNGVEYSSYDNVSSGTYTGMTNGSEPLLSGVSWGNSGFTYADGEMSNIFIFNTELTSTQVATLYNSGKPLPDMSSFTSLQGWWKLDDTATFNSGTSVWSIPDDSSNSNTGTSVGMNASNLVASNINGELIANPMITSPKPIAYYQLGDQSVDNGANYLVPNNSLSDYVFNFSGSRIRLNSTSILQNVSSFTISTWANSNGSSSDRMIFGSDSTTSGSRGLYISARPSGQYKVLLSTDGISNDQFVYSTSGSDNVWRNIIVNWNGTSINLFIDGVFVYTQAVVNSTGNFSIPIEPSIGTQNGTTTSFGFIGKISNVQIWDSILTSGGATVGQVAGGEIATIYNNSSPFQGTQPQVSNLKGWYKLNAADTFDGSNWTITDYGSGGNDGTSVGMDSSNLVVSDLQQTSGYSPYALDFDGVDDYLDCGNDSSLQITGAMTISYWVKGTPTLGAAGVGTLIDSNNPGYLLGPSTAGTVNFGIALTSSTQLFIPTTQQITTTEWHHIVGVYTPSVSMKIYIDGQLSKTETSNIPSSQYAGGNDFKIGYRPCCKIDGQISNVAIWNTDLSSSEINEIFNEGVPSNLNTFSGTAPVSWWQIGSNSSYNSGAWTCLDEIGSNNAVSAGGMTNSDIVDGPGYSASGLGTSSIDIKGDAPYSTANGLSENMDVLDRTLDTPIRNTHSIQLDGVDDYIHFGNVNIFERTDAFSGSCWVFNEGSSINQYIISKRSTSRKGYVLYFNSAGALVFILGPGPDSNVSQVVAAAPSTNTWNHLAFTYDGSSTRAGMKLYINGTPQSLSYFGQSTVTGTIKVPSIPFQISGEAGITDNVLNGKIDEVAMFDSELSASQVASIYNNGTPGNILPLNPVSWHRFESLTTNGGVVTTADSSGNGLTGTVENGASLSTVVP